MSDDDVTEERPVELTAEKAVEQAAAELRLAQHEEIRRQNWFRAPDVAYWRPFGPSPGRRVTEAGDTEER